MGSQLGARYVSRELTHFVGRGKSEREQYELLLEIVRSGWLTHPPHEKRLGSSLIVNPNTKLSDNEMYNPRMVCFCDIPLRDMGIHIRKYSPFGIAFLKDFIVQRGGMPVRYVPLGAKRGRRNVGASEELETVGQYFDRTVRSYYQLFVVDGLVKQVSTECPEREENSIDDLKFFFNFQVFSFLKFFDHTLMDSHPENYYLEREWRVLGNVPFRLEDTSRVILPASYAERFRSDVAEYQGETYPIAC